MKEKNIYKINRSILTFLLLSILAVVGCLSDTDTRPSNDIEAMYKCKLDASKSACEKQNPWWLLLLNQQQGNTASGTGDSGTTTPSEKIMYVSSAYTGDLGGISGADTKCNNDGDNPDTSKTYKALIVDGDNRIACTTANCSGGTPEHKDWVLTPNTTYKRFDGQVGAGLENGGTIGTTNAKGIFDFPLTGTVTTSAGHFYWTGFSIDADWTSASTDGTNTCLKWTNSDGSDTPGNRDNMGAEGSAQQTTNASIGTSFKACNGIGMRLLCVEQ